MIKYLKKFNATLKEWLITLSFLGLVTIILLIILSTLFSTGREIVVIDEFSVDEESKKTIDGRFLSKLLYNEIEAITKKAISQKNSNVTDSSIASKPIVTFEFQGVSVSGLSSLLDKYISKNIRHVSGHALKKDGDLLLIISIDGERAFKVSAPVSEIHKTTRSAAEIILEKTEPYLLARRLMLQENPDYFRVRRLISSILSNDDLLDDFWAWNLSGNILVNQGKYERALHEYRKATQVALVSNNDLSRLSRSNEAGALINLGKYDEASEILKGADIFHNYYAYYMRGLLHFRKRESVKAERYLLKANRLNPYDPDTSNLLGRVLVENEKYVDAIEHLLVAYHIYRDNERHSEADRTLFWIGKTYEDLGEYMEASYIYKIGMDEARDPSYKSQFTDYYEMFSDF